MSMEYCKECDRQIDTDYDAEHFIEHKSKENVLYNLRTADAMREKQPLKDYIPLEITNVFVCVECGDYLPKKVLEFYDYQVGLVKCYSCQRREDENNTNR